MTRKNFQKILAWRRFPAAITASLALAAITCWSAVPAAGQWAQRAELTSSDAGGFFGRSVAIDGNTAVIGAPTATFGSNASQGAAYIFVNNGGVWTQQAELTAADGAFGDEFGWSVSISGNTAVIGAPEHSFNGGTGAAYVFVNNGGSWTQAAELTASDGFFGWSVSIKGDTIVAGAPQKTINGNGLQGAAYVFTNTGSAWTQQAELTAADGHVSDEFGLSVSVDAGNVVIGAPQKTIGSNTSQGAAYVFAQNGSSWSQSAELTAPNGSAGGAFGYGVALSGATAVIGAPNGLGSVPAPGSVYVYQLSSGSWDYSAEMTPSDSSAGNWFGEWVSLDAASGSIAVGAPLTGSGSSSAPGAAYIFAQIAGSWTQQAKLSSADLASSDQFGTSVSISGNTAMVGAPHHNTSSRFGTTYVYGQQGSQLQITSQPSAGTVGSAIDNVAVQLEDAVGNPLSTSGVAVTLASNPTGVNGTLTVNTVAGVAEFSGLTFNAANIYTLTASSPGLTSASSGPIQISQLTQTIVFDPLANQVLGASAFSIGASASSGLPVSFSSLTNTVCSVAGDTVSLLATGQCTLQATQAGDATFAAAVPVSVSFTVNAAPKSYAAPVTAVETTSVVQTATVTFNSGGTLGAISVVTQGATGKDFNAAPGGNCASGTAYTAGQACTVNYTFTPLSPGARQGAVVLKDNSGNVLGTSYLGGTGTGPLGLFTTATQTLSIPGLNTVRGISLDGYGNLYAFETSSGAVDKFAAGTNTKTQLALLRVSSLGGATAVDGAGNVFVSDSDAGALYELAGGTAPAVKVATIPSGDDNLEIDGAGNLYYSGYQNSPTGAIYKVSSGTYQVTTLIAGGVGRRFVGMTVDAAGNIFAADFNNNILYELPAGTSTLVKLASGGYLSQPHGVAVDPAGNVYVSNYNGSTVIRYAAGTYAATLLPAAGQRGIALDGVGNLYTITTDATIAVYTRTQATPFTFAATPAGATSDSHQGVVFENDGNADLLITGYSASGPFALNGSQNTCATGALSSGGSCVVGATFSPLNVGPQAGTATITGNTLGVAGSAQTILLSGTSIRQTPIVAAVPATITYSSTPSVLSGSVTFVGSVLPTGAVTIAVDGGAAVVAACTGSASPLNCNASYSTGALSVGTHTMNVSMAADDNFNAASGSTQLNVNPAAAAISFSVPNHTYGDAPFNLAASSNSSGAFTYSVVSGPATISGSTLTITGAGPVTVQASQVASGNYGAGTQNASFNVAQAQLGVAIVGTPTKTYDGTTSAALTPANFAFSGLVGSDSFTISQTAGTYAAANAGAQTVTATLSAANYAAASGSLANYILPSSATGAGLINRAPASVVVNSSGKVYGQSDPVFSGTLTGFLPSDNVTATYARTAGETVLGGPYSISATLAPAGVLSNYQVSYITSNFTITPAPLSVSAANAARNYGAGNPAFTGTVTGIVNNDAITATYATAASTASGVGTYAIVPALSGAALTNYTVTVNNGVLTVNPAALVVTADNATATYGTAAAPFTGTITGIVNGDAITAAYNSTATIASPVGTYAIVPTLSGAALANYSVTANNGTLTITQAALIVTAANATRTYGAANPGFAGTLSGVVNNDAITATYSTAATLASPAGAYTIVPALSGAALANYNVTSNNGVLTVNPAALTVTANNTNTIYGTAAAPFTGTLVGLLNGDAITASYTSAATIASAVGTFAIVPTLSGAALSNYTVTANNGTLTVAAAPLVVTANNATRQYGSANPVFTGTVAGVVNGDAITATYSTTATAASGVGTYAIVPSISGAAATNYAVNANNGTLTVTAAPLVVTPADASRNYGVANPPFTGTISGIQNDDPITATYSTAATAASAPGSYAITAQLSDPQNKLGNYSVTLNTGTLTVGKQNQLISWAAPAAITYGTPLSAAQLNASVSVANPGVVTYSPAAGTVLDAGTYTLTVMVAGTTEYNPATATVQLTVNKAQPAFSGLKDASQVYHTGSVVFSGVLRAATAVPAGQQVSITVNNVTQNAVLASNGSFTTTFNTASLPVSPNGYTVSYSYAGSNDFAAASATSKLTVSYAVCDLYDTAQAKQSGSTYPITVAVCDANNQNVGTSGMVLTAAGWGTSAPAYSPVPDAGNSNGNGTFRNTGGSFMWNLKTTGMASGAYNVFFTISGDPTLHFAPFAVR